MPAIDPKETANTLFGGMKKSSSSQVKELKTSNSSVHLKKRSMEQLKKDNSKVPKFATLEKVTVLLTSEQKDTLDDIARKLMRFRSNALVGKEERERITANTICRALLDNVIDRIDSLEIEAIQNEAELKTWLEKIFK